MKKVKFFVLVLILSVAFIGCTPDLVVKNLDVNWGVSNKKAKVEIVNIGNKDAGKFLVYFNGDENPESPNRRPQVSRNVPGLAQGASVVLEADFAPLAHPDNNNLGNVYMITVIADPKHQVKESNENNNEEEFLLQAPVVDQLNLVSSGNLVVDNTQSVGQTFTVSQPGQLIGIEVAAVRCLATETDVLTLEVGQGSVSFGTVSITGAGLLGPGQCGVVPAALNLTVNGSGYFDLVSLNQTVVAGQTFFFKLTNSSSRDFRIGISSDLYAGGTATVNTSPSNLKDLAFKIIVVH